MTAVTKGATLQANFRRTIAAHDSARKAFRSFLDAVGMQPGDKILLPSFIGWSAREGSGVFDPVAEAGLEPVFYRLNDRLRIDMAHLEHVISTRSPKVFVPIHYFGYVDPAASEAISLARQDGLLVLEDEAHAMLTDLVGGGSGRQGDAAIFSLHKLLPMTSGGMLVWNRPPDVLQHDNSRDGVSDLAWSYDLWSIAAARRRNAEIIHRLIAPLEEHVEPLWGLPSDTEVPQTYPVLIKTRSRDDLYFEMNEKNFGVTSLYHTLISEISAEEFPESHALARKIMNFPVHQDINEYQLEAMIDTLSLLVS